MRNGREETMKPLEKILDAVKPHFRESGRFGRFWPLFDSVETFLYRIPVPTKSGAHIRDSFDLKRMMIMVMLALVPCIVFGTYNVGYQHFLASGLPGTALQCLAVGAGVIVPMYLVTFGVGLGWEVLFAIIRKEEVSEGFFVTGTLIPLIMPPTLPLWQLALAVTFSVVLGKELFGGTGMNIFNPALLARAFIFFAYPRSISGSGVWTLTQGRVVDTYTMATPLTSAADAAGSVIGHLSSQGYGFTDMFLGFIPGSIGETSIPAIAIGALVLLVTGVGSWRIMLSVFAGGLAVAALVNALAPGPEGMMALPPAYHLVMGGFAFGAVFMATDPVSAAATNTGKYIFGFLIGALTIVIRVFNPAFPEGMMLSILLMNMFAPLIDYGVVRSGVRRRKKHAAR